MSKHLMPRILVAILGYSIGWPAAVCGQPSQSQVIDLGSRDGVQRLLRLSAEPIQAVTLRGLPGSAAGDVLLEPLDVGTAEATFVVGRKGQVDSLLTTFDRAAVRLMRGRFSSAPQSRVFLAIAPNAVVGYAVVSGHWQELKLVESGQDAPPRMGARRLNPSTSPARNLRCSVIPLANDPSIALALDPPRQGLRTLELAVDTDYDFSLRFADLNEAALYVTALYGAISDVFMRDADTRIVLTFVRLWDDPDDLYNGTNPLLDFRTHWSAQMNHVHRDAAQLLTGRRDIAYSGSAWQTSACKSFAYSAVGLLNGTTLGATFGGLDRWDLVFAAHELGHSCGAFHTHSTGVDSCAPTPGAESRGTIMSYCTLHNGGIDNQDARFHNVSASAMRTYLAVAGCIDEDCNANSISDALDVAAGTSADANTNGVPDECEDCNNNGQLDSNDIASGAPDVNGNGVPDACEPDCNTNAIPDALDIVMGTATDANGNAVPDVCEPDCDSNGQPDFAQIQSDLDLDVNRNNLLDACEDCDDNGTIDSAELAGSNHLWAVGSAMPSARRYHSITGARSGMSAGVTFNMPQDVIATADGRILVADGGTNRVLAFDAASGNYVGEHVTAGAGGLAFPTGMAIGSDGHLYLSSRDTDSVLRYSLASGTYIDTFVPPGGELSVPYGLTFGPRGDLYVCSDGTDEVLRYDGVTGAYRGPYVRQASGGPTALRGLTFKRDARLLVADSLSGMLFEYAYESGAFIRVFTLVKDTGGEAIGPWTVRIGSTGFVYAGSMDPADEIVEYYDDTGAWRRSFVMGPYSGLDGLTGFAFVPDFGVDCNVNAFPDLCDIASGFSSDTDTDGVPDECQQDCNSNGVWDRSELVPFGPELDCNYNGVLDSCDWAAGTGMDFDGDGLFDECDGDIDGDGLFNDTDVCDYSPFGQPINSQGGPLGDINDDCVVTLIDYFYFEFCLSDSGPGVAPVFNDCTDVFDLDKDGDVDLDDFGGLQGVLTDG